MQNAKDTFYVTLRNRLAAASPESVCVVRGVARPAILVEENELELSEVVSGAFRLRWTKRSSDHAENAVLDTALCEIRYGAADAASPYAMGRGRELSAIEVLLDAILCPGFGLKQSYSEASGMSAGTAMGNPCGTNVFWREAEPRVTNKDGSRMAVVAVMAYREGGDL